MGTYHHDILPIPPKLMKRRVWDSDNPIGNQILGHTNLTEIDLALDLLWRNDVSLSKIILSTVFYSRSFCLENPKC